MARSKVSVWFDRTVTAVGLLVAASATLYCLVTAGEHDPRFIAAIPVVALMGWYPIAVRRTGGAVEIGLDVCVLVFLATVAPGVEALAIWSLGVILQQAISDKRLVTKLLNSGLGALAGAPAIFVISQFHAAGDAPVPTLTGLVLGALAYFVVDFIVSALSLSLEEATPLRRELAPTGVLAGFGAFVAIASIGSLAALVITSLRPWTWALMIVPALTISAAARTQARGAEHVRRLRVLFDAAVEIQTLDDNDALLQCLRRGAAELLEDPRVRLTGSPPARDEIGIRVEGCDEELWIVSRALNRVRSSVSDDTQGLAALVAIVEEAFAKVKLESAMGHLAWHDSLTGLANRPLFMDRLLHALDRSQRADGRVCVLFCDLDSFKRVNDLFGHAVGDAVLKAVGSRIESGVRRGDTVARLGGDEFAVLIEDVNDADEVARACDRILRLVREPIVLDGRDDLSISVTIGVALAEEDESPDAVLSHADLAMYHAKSYGKDRFELYRLSLGDDRRKRIELVETLRRAVYLRGLDVEYQPVIDLAQGLIVGFETLVRWRRDGEFVSPDHFIPTAEESGLIVGLGDLVLDLMAADLPRLRAAAGRHISIGLNIAAQQLRDADFAERLLDVRGQLGDVSLILEVTERAFVGNDEGLLATIARLVDAGILFAIDDFGMGFSSLGYLQRLPVRVLKVDKSFIANIEDDPRACALVRSIAVMGEALGLDVVIEGIERPGQLAHLVEHVRAPFGQGYLFARPRPLEEIIQLLDEGRFLDSLQFAALPS